jgi:hypothetical protein
LPKAKTDRLLALDVRLELAVVRGEPQLAERLGLDLADALARQLEALADLLEGQVAGRVDSEAHPQDLLFAR